MAYIGAGITRFNTADDLTVTDDAEIGGDLTVTGSADINGGTIDGVTIGGASAGAGTFTTLTATGNVDIDGGTIKLDGNYPVGSNNSAVGDAALSNLAGSGYSSAFGSNALRETTSGSNNTGIGAYAGAANTTGADNVFVGEEAATTNTSGSFNTAVGRTALYSNTTASYNTAVGYYALYANTTGTFNTSFGGEALESNTTSNESSAFGYRALEASNAIGNTGLGFYAGQTTTSGTYNTFVGNQAGRYITTGGKNTIIGRYNGNQGGLDIRTSSNYIVLSDGDGNPRVHFLSGGQLVKNGDSASARIIPQTDNAGYIGTSDNRWQAIYAVNGSIQTSDERQKTDIQDSQLGLGFISALRPVSYKWISGGKHFEYDEDGNPTITDVAGKRNHYGLIAQEVKEALGDVDFGGWVIDDLDDSESSQSLRYDQFIAPLIKAVQEQQETITALTARIEALENQ